MATRLSKWGVWFSLIFGFILIGSTAFAQTPSKEAELAVRADALHAQALQLQTHLSDLSEAARLHIQEAEMRPAYDVTAIDCLTLAGNLFYVAKRPMDARHTMEKAADRALSLGDLQRAGILYLNGSFAAQREGNLDEMNRLGQKADLLTSSPLLSTAQREDIHRRMTHPSVPPKTDRARLAFRADSLHMEALKAQEGGFLTEAARMLKDESKLRHPSDPSAVDNMLLAANLLFVAGRPLEARHALEDAGDRALGAGDIPRAAFAFIDAASVAGQQGNQEEKQRLGRRAEMLSVSDLLTPDQRREITRRIRRVPAV